MKTSELTGPALDWAVATAEYLPVKYQTDFVTVDPIVYCSDWDKAAEYSPSTDWAQGGPIIEREYIELQTYSANDDGVITWRANDGVITWRANDFTDGPTPLIAAMRCYCCVKFGDEVEIPEELI